MRDWGKRPLLSPESVLCSFPLSLPLKAGAPVPAPPCTPTGREQCHRLWLRVRAVRPPSALLPGPRCPVVVVDDGDLKGSDLKNGPLKPLAPDKGADPGCPGAPLPRAPRGARFQTPDCRAACSRCLSTSRGSARGRRPGALQGWPLGLFEVPGGGLGGSWEETWAPGTSRPRPPPLPHCAA